MGDESVGREAVAVNRLIILVEGFSEEAFVRDVLIPHLSERNVYASPTKVKLVSNSSDHGGGIRSFARTKTFIEHSLRRDQNAYFTTMFDLYRLPSSFPGQQEHQDVEDPYKKAHAIEIALAQEINNARFIPYIQLHEFEALLLSDPMRLTDLFPEYLKAITKLTKECEEFESPEHINHRPDTAPASRIITAVPTYSKTAGVLIVQEIGIPTIRQKCKHFDQWLTSLEHLGQA
jgi:Domain of unknown function (DUF4276)